MPALTFGREKLAPAAILRIVSAVVVAAALVWASLSITYGLALATSRPSFALSWLPFGAQAKASVAAELIARGEDIARARQLSREALLRQPVLAAAATTLGLADDALGDRKAALATFSYGERLSRRELGAQLWLIEDAVQRNDIPAALTHYDRALRVKSEARDRLFPILVAATADPAVAAPLRRFIAARPPWAYEFVNALAGSGTNAATLASLVAAVRLDPAVPAQRTILTRSLDRLVALGAPDAAAALYRKVTGAARTSDFVVDPGFTADAGVPPFAWSLSDAEGVSAFRDTVDGRSGTALAARVEAGARGTLARQLVVLPAGSYRLGATIGGLASSPIDFPAVALTCVGSGAVPARLVLPAGGGRRLERAFSIDRSCRAAWLDILAAGNLDGGDQTFWVDDVTIRPATSR